MKTGLKALISESEKDYLNLLHEGHPFMVKGSDWATESLTKLPFLESLESLLKVWTGSLHAHLPDVRDESSSLEITSKDAMKLFNNGMGLLFNDVQILSPFLEKLIQELRHDLKLSMLTYGRCLVYATPDGKGTATHFDQNINFVFQLEGTKTWLIAPNSSVTHPLTRHTLGQAPDPEISTYLEAPFPKSMPSNAQKFTLTPGSILFVPRGAWHSTEAQGDALALNFTFTAPSWLDLFTAALRGRLIQSPEWRETADLNPEKLEMLLAELKHDLPHWSAEDILEVTESL